MIGLLDGHDIATLRTCVSAGEHLPAATWHAWQEATGIAIVDGIGATEMMHIFISASGDDIRPGSTGKAVPGYVATVLDEENRSMASGTGRLAVKGPTGCRYFDDERQAELRRRRLERHRRHLSQGRGGLFLVPRPLRRHDHLVGLQYRRARGGECPALASGGAGMRGDRRALRGARPEGEGLRRPCARLRARRRRLSPRCRTM